ncbi:MAG: DUF937 domain-containing protein [Theionarchaea archaeon]|nr:DUF937 domain-containing protein [Theionarchaea archaeon]
MEEFLKDYGPEVSKQLSSTLGIEQDTALQMIPAIAPLILGGLKRQMEEHGGADKNAHAARVNHILNKYGSETVLDHIDEEFHTQAREKRPDPRLGGLLGDSGVQATDMISKQFGLDKGTAMKVIVMLAPMILGALTRKRERGSVGSRGIAVLIDQDGDDSILGDVAGFLLQGMMGSGSDSSSRSKKGLFGDLLSGLMQPRCPKCGNPVEHGMKFCPECGSRL